jgi:hypothetical protein
MAIIRIFKDDEWWHRVGRLLEEGGHDESGLYLRAWRKSGVLREILVRPRCPRKRQQPREKAEGIAPTLIEVVDYKTHAGTMLEVVGMDTFLAACPLRAWRPIP